jgi:hypothetical protein
MLLYYAFISLLLILYGMRKFILDFTICHLPYTPIPGVPSLEQGDSFLTFYRSGLPPDQAMEHLQDKSPEGKELGLLQMPLFSGSVLNVMDVGLSKQVFADNRTQKTS